MVLSMFLVIGCEGSGTWFHSFFHTLCHRHTGVGTRLQGIGLRITEDHGISG